MSVLSDRLEIRPAVEADRAEMVPMWQDDAFMEFSGGVMDATQANERFDRMLHRVTEIPFAKQAVVERSSSRIVGYTGVDLVDFEDEIQLEWGYRLVPDARGKGYATEAGQALMAFADTAVTEPTRVLAIIDPRNAPSQNVATKLGFSNWKHVFINGFWDDLWTRQLG